MNVKVPALAPTTPPDMGASTKKPCCVVCTALATSREEEGSIVEQSIKRRLGFATLLPESAGCRILPKTFFTCEGSGRTVIVVSYESVSMSHQKLTFCVCAMRKYQRIGYCICLESREKSP